MLVRSQKSMGVDYLLELRRLRQGVLESPIATYTCSMVTRSSTVVLNHQKKK